MPLAFAGSSVAVIRLALIVAGQPVLLWPMCQPEPGGTILLLAFSCAWFRGGGDMITAEIEESVSHKADESCGRALAGIRRLRGRTGADVARESGLSRRTITKVEQGDDSVAFRSYLKVADVLGATWLFRLFDDTRADAGLIPAYYLTGASALCLPGRGDHPPALWYTHRLSNPGSWQIAGAGITSSINLLGVNGLWDATSSMASLGVKVHRIWAASHERAIFDLLYHFCEVSGKPIPNIQASDIDDVVSLGDVSTWMEQLSPFISAPGLRRMRAWLES